MCEYILYMHLQVEDATDNGREGNNRDWRLHLIATAVMEKGQRHLTTCGSKSGTRCSDGSTHQHFGCLRWPN